MPPNFEDKFDTILKDKNEKKIEKPKMYKVVLLNDDFTTMEFVVQVLETIFHHTKEAAESIMKSVHQTGKGIAGIYTFDVAETKAMETMAWAKVNEFPLVAKLEKDENS